MPGTTFTPPFLTRYRRAYNALIDVDNAYAQLRRNRQYERAIHGALQVIKDHRAKNVLGVTLLHRHFQAGPSEVFVERRFTPRAKGHATVLVTTPMRAPDAPARIAPHRFSFTSTSELQPLEFTTDPTAIRGSALLAGDDSLRSDLAEVIVGSGLDTLLGVGVYARDKAVAKATSVFLEESRERSSVVHILPRMPRAPGRIIPTVWTFGWRTDNGCAGGCQAYCHGHNDPGGGLGYCGHRQMPHSGRT